MANLKQNYFQKRTKDRGPRSNNRISSPEVQVIASDGENLGILILMILEYLFLEKYKFFKLPYVLRTTMYVSVIVLILVIGAFGKNEFIYFQF